MCFVLTNNAFCEENVSIISWWLIFSLSQMLYPVKSAVVSEVRNDPLWIMTRKSTAGELKIKTWMGSQSHVIY